MIRCTKRTARLAHVFDCGIVLLLFLSIVTVISALQILTSDVVLRPVIEGLIILAAVVMGAGGLLVAWGVCVEPHFLRVQRLSVELPIDSPLKIAIASDFHIGIFKSKSLIKKVVQKINALHADIILLPGDFLDDEDADLADLEPLQNLQARYGVFAVTGNHDAGAYITYLQRTPYFKKDRTEDLQKKLTSLGITFLRNSFETLMIQGEKLVIAGTDDAFMKSFNPTKTLSDVPNDATVILLSHTPDVILHSASHRADLIVSGHTHGGQIRLPFIGPLFHIPDKIGRHFDRGLFHITNNCTLAISQGVGMTGARARLFCPPEILLLETTH